MSQTNNPDSSDSDLIKQCLDGQSSAWEVLIARYEKLIYFTALQTCKEPPDADDVFQNVCIILLKELKNLRNTDRLAAWLVTTTRREGWARSRREQNRSEELTENFASVDTPEQISSIFEDALLVQAALRKINDPCRQLIRLLYFDPQHPSYIEIADHLGISVNSIGPTRARCMEKLRRILNKIGF